MRRSVAAALLLLLAFCGRRQEIEVQAAASLTEALTETAAEFRHETGIEVRINFGGSSILARQIEQGAPADVFFSADEAKMDALDSKGLILRDTRAALLSNRLAIVVPEDSAQRLSTAEDLTRLSRIALAQPDSVPAGIYAREYLTTTGVWPRVAPRIVPTESVRGALLAVEKGNVDAAIVYRTDASICRKCRVAFEVTGPAAPKITYPVAVVSSSEHPGEALRFVEYLKSARARAIFSKYGFL